MRFTTAIRMNATFPYIMPNVFLPTTPAIQTMDAGLRDNYGMETSLRYLDVFKEWIAENVGEVVIVQFRDMKKNPEPKVEPHQSVLQKMFDPINSIYSNWNEYEDYHFDNQINNATSWLGKPLHVISFEYSPAEQNQSASMSWHLTSKEKQDVKNAAGNSHNQEEIKKLLSLLK